MIELNSMEVKTVTDHLHEYNYGLSLDDRIKHIHQMTRDGYAVMRHWTTDKGYHASFVKSSIDRHQRYAKGMVESKHKRIPGDKLEEIYNPEEIILGTTIDTKA